MKQSMCAPQDFPPMLHSTSTSVSNTWGSNQVFAPKVFSQPQPSISGMQISNCTVNIYQGAVYHSMDYLKDMTKDDIDSFL